MPYSATYKTLLSLLLAVMGSCCLAQKKAPVAASYEYYPKIRFIYEAPVMIPGLVREGKWDLVQNYIENWKRSDVPNDELIFGISSLSAIENNRFSIFQLPCDYLYFLDDYARELKNIDDHSARFQYYVQVTEKYSYDATVEARRLILFLRSWSRRLIATRSLDSTGSFVCRVLSGEIQHPRAWFRRNRPNYAALNIFQQNVDQYYSRYHTGRRSALVPTCGIMTGIWSPTGNLQLLGAHPSVSVFLGVRNKKNEYDIVWSFRFLHPTPGEYVYSRDDTLYTSHYYDGGYIGLDYTRYIISRPRFELGFTSAVAYDYFSVANGWGSEQHTAPINVGSFDFSNGFRIKYFFHRHTCIGLAAKYHLINYCNTGGTDLGGDAFTIDLIYGSH